MKPEDRFKQKHKTQPEEAIQKKRIVPEGVHSRIDQSFNKAGKGAKTLDQRIQEFQLKNEKYRTMILTNEEVLLSFFFMLGLGLSYAVNRCTGSIGFSALEVILGILLFIFFSQLLSTAGIIPLEVMAKFLIVYSTGHLVMMYFIAADGRYFHWITIDSCHYPVTYEDVFKLFAGFGAGFIFCKMEHRIANDQ